MAGISQDFWFIRHNLTHQILPQNERDQETEQGCKPTKAMSVKTSAAMRSYHRRETWCWLLDKLCSDHLLAHQPRVVRCAVDVHDVLPEFDSFDL
jgi:hypothetical protein